MQTVAVVLFSYPFILGLLIGFLSFYILHTVLKPNSPESFNGISIGDTTTPKLPKLQEECKMVLLVRQDLAMGKGKAAAQCSHATLAAYQRGQKTGLGRHYINHWESEGMTKVTLKCPDESTMLKLQKEARRAGLVGTSILDAGRTQITEGSRTVLAIGPGPVSIIDAITGHLKLY